MDQKIEALLQQMTLEEKAGLLSGADNWHTRAIERLGIPAIRMTDGPHGVRRPYDDDPNSWPATCFPTATAMAATWNIDLVKRVGEALAVETKTKGCDILLGPAVNIHRAPLCGRNFEYFSEDPYLAGRLAVAWIQGLQSRGVGASLKHYAANNSEFERFTISSEIDERTLHEIYLPAFKMAVEEADPWTVMCSYNKVNGTWASEHPYLLTDLLKKAWGFKGFVVSDWGAMHHRIHATNAGLDLEMPGIGEVPVQIVVDAVQRGLIPQAALDEAVRRILRVVFLARDGQPEKTLEPGASDLPEHRQLALEMASEAVVLLKNEGSLLPLQDGKVRSIAVFGPNAAEARIEGGGSSRVNPYYAVSPLEAIRQRAGEGIEVLYSQGCKNDYTPPLLDGEHIFVQESGNEHGFQASYFANGDFSGEPVLTRVEPAARFSTHGMAEAVVKQMEGKPLTVRWAGTFAAPVSGVYVFGLSSAGQSRLLVNGQVVVDHWNDPNLAELMAAWPFRSKTGTLAMEAGQSYEIVIEYLAGAGWRRLSASLEIPLPADELDRVARLAAGADVAVVCVGTTWEHETEGRDRQDWNLPGDQANLIRVVAKANPRTVVVLTNGTTIDIASWSAKVPAVLEGWFNGQESGSAIAAVLFGDVNPSGKLPETYPVYYKDNPSYINYPGENGRVLYGEGLFIGYRYYDMKDVEPLYPFGYGLSYTSFAYENLRLSTDLMAVGGKIEAQIDVRNTGTRAGKEVVQLYVRDVASRLVRPPKELKGFEKVALAPGEAKTVRFTLTEKELSYYDPDVKAWVAEAGVFEILIGSSSRDIRASGKFTLQGRPASPKPRLNADSSFRAILDDPQGRAVLEAYLPEVMKITEGRRNAEHINLRRMSLTFMEYLPPEKYEKILAELAKIP